MTLVSVYCTQTIIYTFSTCYFIIPFTLSSVKPLKKRQHNPLLFSELLSCCVYMYALYITFMFCLMPGFSLELISQRRRDFS